MDQDDSEDRVAAIAAVDRDRTDLGRSTVSIAHQHLGVVVRGGFRTVELTLEEFGAFSGDDARESMALEVAELLARGVVQPGDYSCSVNDEARHPHLLQGRPQVDRTAH